MNTEVTIYYLTVLLGFYRTKCPMVQHYDVIYPMIGLWLLVDMVHPSCLHKHILDPAIVAHLNPSLRVIRLKHPVSGELFAHAIHQPLGGKRFAAGDAAEYLVLIQYSRCPPDIGVSGS